MSLKTISTLATIVTLVTVAAIQQSLIVSSSRRTRQLKAQLDQANLQVDHLIFVHDRDRERAANSDDEETKELWEATFKAARTQEMRRHPKYYRQSSEADLPKADPGNIVRMANRMAGKKTAELTQVDGVAAIHLNRGVGSKNDPLWTVLDAASSAKILDRILLIGKGNRDIRARNHLKLSLIHFGIPSKLIQLKTADAGFRGMEGVVIKLAPSGRHT